MAVLMIVVNGIVTDILVLEENKVMHAEDSMVYEVVVAV